MNNLNHTFLSELEKYGFKGDIATEESGKIVYSTDNSIYEIKPEGILFPRSQNDVELIFRLLRQEKYRLVKITARGGGTSTNGQSINSGFIVDYSRYMNRIIEIDPENMVAKVEPGIILDVLNKELAKHNLFFPPNISPSNRATIGGMVNTDACGKGSCIYGRTSDNIYDLTLHLINEENPVSSNSLSKIATSDLGEILRLARKSYSSRNLSRCNTGYNVEKSYADDGKVDLNYLISGSEGTLALVSKITIKLKKLPFKKRIALFRYSNFDNALADAQNLIALKADAIETVDEHVIALAKRDVIWQEVGHLIGEASDNSINIVEFSYQNEDDFQHHLEKLEQQLSNKTEFLFENYFVSDDKAVIANIWNLRKQGVGLLGAMNGKRRPIPFVEDTIVPPKQLAPYIKGFRAILEKYEVVYGMFGHVDAGCLHVRPALNLRQEQDRRLIKQITDEVANLLLAHQGLLWGEHGKGFRGKYIEKFLGKEATIAFTKIKQYFDPFDQLNHGKIANSSGKSLPEVDQISMRGNLDENISPQMHDEFEAILSCNGNALCFNLENSTAMCPSYKATLDRRYSPKGRAMLFKEWIRKNHDLPSIRNDIKNPIWSNFSTKFNNLFKKDFEAEIHESFSKCLGCKACNTQCPIKVSIPDAKAYFFSLYFTKHFRKIEDYLIGYIEGILPLLGKFPHITNAILQNNFSKIIFRKIFGVVDIPRLRPLSKKNLQPHNNSGEKIYLLCDAYSNYFNGEELEHSYQLLSKLGFNVEISKVFESGKALHSKGFLNQFRKTIKRNIEYFKSLDGRLIALDPSMSLSYADEYRRFTDERIEVLYLAELIPKFIFNATFKQSIFEDKIEEKNRLYRDIQKVFLFNFRPKRRSLNVTLKMNFGIIHQKEFLLDKASDKQYHLILHCSEQTNISNIAIIWQEIFNKFGLTLNIIKAGCCGMSGSFGLEVKNFSDSKKIFKDNWQEIVERLGQDKNNIVMVSGSSCKAQLERFAGSNYKHPVTILSKSIQNSVQFYKKEPNGPSASSGT